MKTIYLCGPIHDLSTSEANEWRMNATTELEYKTSIFQCLDPMRRQFNDEDQLGVNEIVLMDLKDVEDAYILLVNYNVARGETTLCGTAMEVFYASHILGKFVIAFTDLPKEKWSPWMMKYCTRILPSLDEAIEYIKRHF